MAESNTQNRIDYLAKVRNQEELSFRDRILLILTLSGPAILAQLSSVVMELIDSAMVGHMGANAAAAIGLVSSTTWLFGGLGSAFCVGYAVQIANMIGAGKEKAARNLVKEGLSIALGIGLVFMCIGLAMGGPLPAWLGGSRDIHHDATVYFRYFALFMPIYLLNQAAGSMIQCSGNMKIPGMLHILMGILNVIFNFFLIFPTRMIDVLGYEWKVIGAGMGVSGAAIGTGISETIVASCMLYYLMKRSDMLAIRKGEKLSFIRRDIVEAFKISVPVAVESMALCSAYIMMTKIISPLGAESIAAHSFAITIEGLCYMAAYGISSAAVTIVGQSVGAGRGELAMQLSWVAMRLGMILMLFSGVIMFIFAPWLIGILTPDATICMLGAKILRIEAFAEPFYGASIIGSGIFRGAKETKIPSIINLFSMWVIRLPMAYYLSLSMGLVGAWIAMCMELMIRGLLYLIRLRRKGRAFVL